MDKENYKLNKIKYMQDKIESIDDQIAELVSERFNIEDQILSEIYRNNIDLDQSILSFNIDKDIQEFGDESVTKFLCFLHELSNNRHKYIFEKYNSRYACVGKGNGFYLAKNLYKEIMNIDYFHFSYEENLLSRLLSRKNFYGLNIGYPYKTEIIEYLDDVTNQVKEIGEANLVQFYKSKKYGFNTEYFGIIKLLEKFNVDIYGKDVVILSDNNKNKTIEYVAKSLNAKSITTIDVNAIDKNKKYNAQIIISSVIFDELDEEKNISLDNFYNLEVIVDLSYRPYYSPLFLEAKEKNIFFINGIYKIMYQEKKSMEILLKRRFDDKVFEKILLNHIKDNLNIVLVGMPGAGKTTIGKKLSKLINRKHFDLDKEFQKEYGISPSEFLRYESEKLFREKEHKIVKKLSNYNNVIISTSGGIVTKDENYYLLKKNSIIFRVDRDLNKLSTKNRPLSEGGIETLIKMYDDRMEKYNQYTDYYVKNYGDFNSVAYKIKEIFENLIIN